MSYIINPHEEDLRLSRRKFFFFGSILAAKPDIIIPKAPPLPVEFSSSWPAFGPISGDKWTYAFEFIKGNLTLYSYVDKGKVIYSHTTSGRADHNAVHHVIDVDAMNNSINSIPKTVARYDWPGTPVPNPTR